MASLVDAGAIGLKVEAVPGFPGIHALEVPNGAPLDRYHALRVLDACSKDPKLVRHFNGLAIRRVPIALKALASPTRGRSAARPAARTFQHPRERSSRRARNKSPGNGDDDRPRECSCGCGKSLEGYAKQRLYHPECDRERTRRRVAATRGRQRQQREAAPAPTWEREAVKELVWNEVHRGRLTPEDAICWLVAPEVMRATRSFFVMQEAA